MAQSDHDRTVGALLRTFRSTAGLTQQELAELSGLSVEAISTIERGARRRPHPHTLRALASALGLRAADRTSLFEAAGRGPRVQPERDNAAGHDVHVVPRQLPAAVRHFAGRRAELQVLAHLLDQAADPAAAVVISAIGGMAGIGKTTLAVYWAHQAAERFPDGQLYADLHGFDPAVPPSAPGQAVRGFLRALGVPAARIPAEIEEQASLYRSLLAGKRVLVVLDNARDETQARPLLPGDPSCLALVTSRDPLAGLIASHGARSLILDVLTTDDARELLARRLGAERLAAEPAATSELIGHCAGLPLALAITAARATATPRLPLASLASHMSAAADRLDVLDLADATMSVRHVFASSCNALTAEAARMFRLLGTAPGPDISTAAAASLAACSHEAARTMLRDLTRAELLAEHAPGRFRCHDLLRAYAASMAREHDPEPDRAAATDRILDHYLQTASHNAMLLQPAREPAALPPPRPGTRPERPGDQRQAMAWYKAEHQVLLAAVTMAAETGADTYAWQLPWAMSEYLHRRGYPHEHLTVMRTGLTAATRLDDPLGQARSLRGLGIAYASIGNLDQARAHLERCIPLYRQLDDPMGEAMAQQNLSALAATQGRHPDSLSHSRQALRLFQALGHDAGKAQALGNIAWSHAVLGDYQQARSFCQQSLDLIAETGRCHFEHTVRDTLGYIEHHLGNLTRAAEHFAIALMLCRDHGHRYQEAEILTHIADTHHVAGQIAQAREAWQQALAIYDDIQHPDATEVRTKLASTDG